MQTTEETQIRNESEFDMYRDQYVDDIEGHIEMLTIELSIIEPESDHADDLRERIKYLKERMIVGDAYVDNDITSSPNAWKTLATYTEAEARDKFQEWC